MKKLISFFLALFLLMISQLGHFAFATVIQLQPHQKVPVEYLMEHPEQKGLLLYHSMGSGKTYIALDYAEKNPSKKVLILLPSFLKSNWLTQMTSFGVKDPTRYELIALEESEKLLSTDLKDKIVIIDEVHKLVQKIRLSTGESSEKMIQVYEKVKTADKIILLTGTPIFSDTSDIAYLANLFDQEDRYPVDPIKFRTEYMRINPTTSLVRGHVTESKLMMVAVPFFVTLGAVVTLGTALPWAIPLVALGGSAVIPVTNEIFPVSQVTFREFDTDKWKDFSEKYVSFYQVKLTEDKNYPTKQVFEKQVEYNDEQANFFLSFVDEDLSPDQIRIMLADQKITYTNSYLKYHSSRIQKQLLTNPTAGLEIGNLDFLNKNKQIVESPKFLEVLKAIRKTPGQVAIYSNFNENGIQRFARFLDRNEFKGQYLYLTPDLTVDQQMKIVEQYNQGNKKILLIHPEITEGISLLGTEQFHVLEPIRSATLLDQIVGRAIRYQSHKHLAPERQAVAIYLWESNVDYSHFGIPTSAGQIRREHWQKNYSEVNPSMWSKGILEVDSNYFLKDETPDARVKRHKSVIQKDVESYRKMLQDHSIETQ